MADGDALGALDADFIARALAHRFLLGEPATIATADQSDDNLAWLRASYPEAAITAVTADRFVEEAERRFGDTLADAAANGLARDKPMLSARMIINRSQIAALFIGAVALIATIALTPYEASQTIAAILSISFLAGTMFRAVLAVIGARVRATHDAPALEPLPVYTILVPLYREANVLPRLARALLLLDYPDMLAQREKQF